MKSNNEFTPPVDGECICQLTSSYKSKKSTNLLLRVLLVSCFIYIIDDYLVKQFNTSNWIVFLIHTLAIIAVFIIPDKLPYWIDKSFIYYTEEENIFFSSEGLFYELNHISHKPKYIFSYNKINHNIVIGLINGELLIKNRKYKASAKYIDNLELFVSFLNNKQKEWLKKENDEYDHNKQLVLQKAIEDGIEKPRFGTFTSDPSDISYKGKVFRVYGNNKIEYYKIDDDGVISSSSIFKDLYFWEK